jgi:hypothetical protein
MAVESESNHINQNVFLELLPISDHKFWAPDNWFRVTSIHSKNRDTERFYNIRWIFETSIILRTCCETDLIVCYNVKTAITAEFRKFAQS